MSLHPWPVVNSPLVRLTRDDAAARLQVMIVSRELGAPVVIHPGSAAMTAATKAGVFNRMNWNRFRPQRREGLADSNSSPVLFWVPPSASDSVLTVGNLGSQADAMHAVSANYKRWANRAMNWVRRKGTKVWGNERSEVRPDLDIQLNFVNNVYALPGALAAMDQGVPGPQRALKP